VIFKNKEFLEVHLDKFQY